MSTGGGTGFVYLSSDNIKIGKNARFYAVSPARFA